MWRRFLSASRVNHSAVRSWINEQGGRLTTALRHVNITTPGFTATSNIRINYRKGTFVGRDSIHKKMFDTVTVTDQWDQCRLCLQAKDLLCTQRTQINNNNICVLIRCHGHTKQRSRICNGHRLLRIKTVSTYDATDQGNNGQRYAMDTGYQE